MSSEGEPSKEGYGRTGAQQRRGGGSLGQGSREGSAGGDGEQSLNEMKE